MYRVLFVDDDAAYHLLFRNISTDKLTVVCCDNGYESLDLLKNNGPYQVVVSDYEMPGMNGVELLKQVRETAPATVRILISGKADLSVALDAVNEGNVFRMLTKPCSSGQIKKALRDALEHYRLNTLEAQMLSKTTRGVIRLVSDMASMLQPGLSSRTARILPLVRSISTKIGDPDPWSTEVAAVLSMIGYIFLPEQLQKKIEQGEVLNSAEYHSFVRHTHYSSKIMLRMPRFNNVCTTLSLQEAHFVSDDLDGGFSGDEIPLGARILKVVSDYDRLKCGERCCGKVISMMKCREKRYDPKVVTALVDILGSEAMYQIREVYPLGLAEGMELAEDIFGTVKNRRVKFLSKGQKLDTSMIDYIHRNAEKIIDITKKISIREKIFS